MYTDLEDLPDPQEADDVDSCEECGCCPADDEDFWPYCEDCFIHIILPDMMQEDDKPSSDENFEW